MNRLRAIGAFAYDFVIGDDWRVALGVVVALVVAWGLHRASVPVWWLVPVAVLALLAMTVTAEARRQRRRS